MTQHFLHAVPWLNYYETFGLYGLDVVYLTVAEQFYLLKKKRIKRPPLKMKKCLSNKTWVPLGPSTLGPNWSGGGGSPGWLEKHRILL